MHCPHCDQPLIEQTCPHCQASLLDTGPYCSYCGRRREETEAADVAPVGSTDGGGVTGPHAAAVSRKTASKNVRMVMLGF